MKKKNNKKDKKNIIVIGIIILILVIGLAYAWFKFSDLSDKTNSITTGNIEIKLDEYDGKTIELNNTVPMTDQAGIKTKAYEFTIINKSSMKFRYQIKLVLDDDEIQKDDCSDKLLDDDVIRYQLIRDNSYITIDTLSSRKDWILDTQSLSANKTTDYSLRLWIDKDATNEYMNKHFHAKVEANLIEDK